MRGGNTHHKASTAPPSAHEHQTIVGEGLAPPVSLPLGEGGSQRETDEVLSPTLPKIPSAIIDRPRKTNSLPYKHTYLLYAYDSPISLIMREEQALPYDEI